MYNGVLRIRGFGWISITFQLISYRVYNGVLRIRGFGWISFIFRASGHDLIRQCNKNERKYKFCHYIVKNYVLGFQWEGKLF